MAITETPQIQMRPCSTASRSTAFICVCQPLPWARYRANTSTSTRNAICSLRFGGGKPRCATASDQSCATVAGASTVNVTSASDSVASRAQSVLSVFAVTLEPCFFFMGECLSGRNKMRNIAVFTAWCPHHEQDNALEQAQALQTHLTIGIPRIFAREQIAKEETVKVCKIDTVIGPIQGAFGFIPCVHALNCICNLYIHKELDKPTIPVMLCLVAAPKSGSTGLTARQKRRKQPRLSLRVESGFCLRYTWHICYGWAMWEAITPAGFLCSGLSTYIAPLPLFDSRKTGFIYKQRSSTMTRSTHLPVSGQRIAVSVFLFPLALG